LSYKDNGENCPHQEYSVFVKDEVLKASIEPNRRWFTLNFNGYPQIPKDLDKIGVLIFTEEELIITAKKNVESRAGN